MDTLQMMRIFVRVAEGAASRSPAPGYHDGLRIAVGRAARNAPAHARLLNRSTRRIALTDAGQRYLDCQRILGYIDEAEAEAAD